MNNAVNVTKEISQGNVNYKVGVGSKHNVWVQLLLKSISQMNVGTLTITLPNAEQFIFEGQRAKDLSASVVLADFRAARMILKGGDIGFGESYMNGYWYSPDVTALIELAIANEKALGEAVVGKWFTRTIDFFKCLLNANTKSGSRRNISYHYDLGNNFYQEWLDPSMTYSAALFESEGQDLTSAQRNKYRFISELAQIKNADRVLEIGCGWGGFAEHVLTNTGANITGLTLSKEQLQYADERLSVSPRAGEANLRLEDYRDHNGQYDAIVSIEMFEAVGERNWDTYFKAIRKNLKQGGKAIIQVITIADDRYETYRKSPDFIQKYIFPGGFLPSKGAFQSAACSNGLNVEIRKEFGLDYARTLSEWADGFEKKWPLVEAQGFDIRFKRMWEFYLKYCEAGFRQKTLDVVIFELS